MKRLVLAAALLAAAAPALAQGELKIGLQDDPDTLDPATNWSFVGRHVLQSLCDKLVDVDQKGSIVPMLATAWEWGDDGKTLVFKLRPNVKFHDGEAFDIGRASQPAFLPSARYRFARILPSSTAGWSNGSMPSA